MSTTEAVKKWIVAEVGASVALKAITGSPGPVWSAGDDLPSRTGVYVRVPRGRRRHRFGDEVRVELLCVNSVGEQRCHDMLTALRAILDVPMGAVHAWASSPFGSGLRLSGVILDDEEAPDAAVTESGSSVWVGGLVLRVIGRASSLPS